MEGSKTSGRARKFGESLHPIVRGIATKMNKSGKPVAAPKLAKALKEEHNIVISVRSLRRVLRRMGMRFMKG
jgi:transposase